MVLCYTFSIVDCWKVKTTFCQAFNWANKKYEWAWPEITLCVSSPSGPGTKGNVAMRGEFAIVKKKQDVIMRRILDWADFAAYNSLLFALSSQFPPRSLSFFIF